MALPTNNPPSDIDMDSSDSEAAMAAAMGFSGFGKAPATKKRKYNAKTDAFIDGQELQNIDRGGKKGEGSGGNEVPLGRMRVLGAQAQAPTAQEQEVVQGRNREEIDLNMDEGIEEDRPMEERCLDTSRPPPVEEQMKNKSRRAERRGKPLVNEDEIMLDDDDDEDETGTAPPAADTTAAQEAQSKIDAILAASADSQPAALMPEVTHTSARKQKQKQKPKPLQGLAAFMTAFQTPVLPPPSIPPPPGTTSSASPIPPAPGTAGTAHPYSTPSMAGTLASSSTTGSSHGGSRAGPRGQRNELWYVDYYDPGFNENPWKQLEKELGLPSVGTWLERPPRNQHQRSV